MNNQDPFDNANYHFLVTYELLTLFRWLYEYEPEAIEKLIQKALSHGLQDVIFDTKIRQYVKADDLQQSILDFFGICEAILKKELNETEFKQTMQRNLLPSLDQIDSTSCGNYTVTLSADKAATICSNNPNKNPKEILCKELLRRWKPSKKLTVH